MKSSSYIDLQRFMLIPTKFPLTPSHPVWVRGLKLCLKQSHLSRRTSHPVWVRGLKLLLIFLITRRVRSHPVWVRGLKLQLLDRAEQKQKSHPVWVFYAVLSVPLHN